MSELMTVEELAEKLKVSDRTIRRLCASGDIPFLYIGSQIRFEQSDINNYLNSIKKGVNENDRKQSNQ